jgi:hypothetical protein
MNDEDEKLRKALAPKSNQLNADDLISGAMTIKVERVVIDIGDQPISIFYEGSKRPYKPCKTMGRVIREAWGGPQKWIGRSMTIFRDATVTWAGAEVGGIRISHMSDIKERLVLSLTLNQKTKRPYIVLPLSETKPVLTIDIAALQTKAAGVALGGSGALKAWFTGLTNEEKIAMKPHMEQYKADALTHDQPSSIIGD